jgi:hypothetical protein
VVNTKKSITGKLTLLRTQFDALLRNLPKGASLTDAQGAMLQFSYLSEGNVLMVIQVDNLKFNSVEIDAKGGEAFKEVPLDFKGTGIRYNVGQ